jgi:hypothetical protein
MDAGSGECGLLHWSLNREEDKTGHIELAQTVTTVCYKSIVSSQGVSRNFLYFVHYALHLPSRFACQHMVQQVTRYQDRRTR